MGDSPVLQPIDGIFEAGAQVSDAHLLLLQWCQILLRRRGADAMVVCAGRILHVTPAGEDRSHAEEAFTIRPRL